MKKFIVLLILLLPIMTLAQEQAPLQRIPPQDRFPEGYQPNRGPAGQIRCFDYYHFGSIQADVSANLTQSTPGSVIHFSGKLKNENEYPVVDGKLIAKVFYKNETTFTQSNGNEIVDQFTVVEQVDLAGKKEIPVAFDWRVPNNARGGDYYVAFFFHTSGRYNLLGLSFTDDVVGNRAIFSVTNESDPKTIRFLKNDAFLNDSAYKFVDFPPHFERDASVNAKIKIQNPSSEVRTVPVQWNQYTWDAAREENRQNTKTELVTLNPGEVKEISYLALPTASVVTYITATVQDGESKSLVGMRFVRDGIEETRINFPSITKFPIKAGEEQMFFACAHSTNLPVVKDNKLILTLKDKNDSIITQHIYDGDIRGNMSGFGQKFTSDKDYDYVKMEASLFRGGSEMEKVEVVYDCQKIDSSSCNSLSSNIVDNSKDIFSIKWSVILLGLAGLMLLILGVVFLRRKPKNISW